MNLVQYNKHSPEKRGAESRPNPTRPNPSTDPTSTQPAQSNSWMNPADVHLCYGENQRWTPCRMILEDKHTSLSTCRESMWCPCQGPCRLLIQIQRRLDRSCF